MNGVGAGLEGKWAWPESGAGGVVTVEGWGQEKAPPF